MADSEDYSAAEVVVHASGRTDPPELRLLHYNGLLLLKAGSREPVGGITRFQYLCDHYRNAKAFEGQPKLLTLFSGDAFNPSLESSVTKGSHIVPFLNRIGTDCACVGNHDLDFGVSQFQHLAAKCTFPWLLANVLDPALGENVPLGNAKRTVMLTASNGLKVGVIGLVEREWLATINSLPPNLIYKSASATAIELVPELRKAGADLIVALTHQREPNDIKLATKTPEGLIDIILGGHDHYYQHGILNKTHILRSGTDFKQLSYIKAWRKQGEGEAGWDVEIIRRDVTGAIPEDKETVKLVDKLTSGLKSKLEKPIGYTSAPLDARFTTARLKESNLGNFVCDLMRFFYSADCAIMAGGTIRGDQIYPVGVLKMKDVMNCFPFEDPVVVLKVSGRAIWDALENAVSKYPALEGRFPQVSNIEFEFSPDKPEGSRIKYVKIGRADLDTEKVYVLATRGYMGRGKDGYDSLLVESEGGKAVEVVSEENGILISMLLRQYFMSLKILGKWRRWSQHFDDHWGNVHDALHEKHPVKEPAAGSKPVAREGEEQQKTKVHGHVIDSDSEDEHLHIQRVPTIVHTQERELLIMRKVLRKWWRVTGMPGHPGMGDADEGEFTVTWTKGIAPQLEGRIKITQKSPS